LHHTWFFYATAAASRALAAVSFDRVTANIVPAWRAVCSVVRDLAVGAVFSCGPETALEPRTVRSVDVLTAAAEKRGFGAVAVAHIFQRSTNTIAKDLLDALGIIASIPVVMVAQLRRRVTRSPDRFSPESINQREGKS
jgi:hypothetical protein